MPLCALIVFAKPLNRQIGEVRDRWGQSKNRKMFDKSTLFDWFLL